MNTAIKTVSTLLIVLLFSIILPSCDGDEGNDDLEGLTRISIQGGNRQTERVGAVLPVPMRVKVTDILGQPKFGIPVFFIPAGMTFSVTTHVLFGVLGGLAAFGVARALAGAKRRFAGDR